MYPRLLYSILERRKYSGISVISSINDGVLCPFRYNHRGIYWFVLLEKTKFVSVWIPSIVDSVMTLLIYREKILLNGHLYIFALSSDAIKAFSLNNFNYFYERIVYSFSLAGGDLIIPGRVIWK